MTNIIDNIVWNDKSSIEVSLKSFFEREKENDVFDNPFLPLDWSKHYMPSEYNLYEAKRRDTSL